MKTSVCVLSWFHFNTDTLITSSYFKIQQEKNLFFVPCWNRLVWKFGKRKQMMSLTRFSIHCSHFLCSYTTSQFLCLLLLSPPFVNEFPVEASTWISQTIYPKLQENWLQILERKAGGKKEYSEVKMLHRVFIHQSSHGCSTGLSSFKITLHHPWKTFTTAPSFHLLFQMY